MTIPESLTVRAVWAGLQKFGGFAFGWMARRRATNAALAGEDYTARNSLEAVVKAALESLASRDTELLPAGVQPAAFRNWLRDPRNLSLFAQATIAYSASVETVASESDRELISNYEALTH